MLTGATKQNPEDIIPLDGEDFGDF